LFDPRGKCTCTSPQIQRYRSKISGPLLDRIDIQIEVPRVEYKDLAPDTKGESSSKIRKRVNNARRIQTKRLKQAMVSYNARMHSRHLEKFCSLNVECENILKQAVDVLGFSARACHSIIRVARTIADLETMPIIKRHHLAEAIQFRSFDRRFTP
jgi:magnesium chelatase family protein